MHEIHFKCCYNAIFKPKIMTFVGYFKIELNMSYRFNM